MRRRLAITLVSSLLVTLAACSGGGTASDPAAAFDTAKSKLDGSAAVTIKLKSSTGLPKGRNGVSEATGTGLISATTPKFKGSLSAVIKGTPGGVEIISVGKNSWMSFFTAEFSPVDLDALGAPNPALLFTPGTGISSILSSATDRKGGEDRRLGKEVLQTYTGTIPGSIVKNLLRLGDGTSTFQGVFGILPGTGEMRLAEITGAFYAPTISTYTLVLTDYGKTIDIQEP